MMYGWLGERADEGMDVWIGEWVHGCMMGEWMDGQMSI